MDAIIEAIKRMSHTRIMILSISSIIVIIGIIFMFTRITNENYKVLYSNLDMQDSSEIVNELESRGISYEIRAGGSQIVVPDEKVLRLRMVMAEKGIPSKGSVGYEIFDKSESIGTSNFMQNVNLLRALEGELGRTISSFSQVESARVHLVIPRREIFTKDVQKPSASVMVKLRGSSTLGKDEINAITHFVASAVPDLETNRITIVDGRGKSIKLSSDQEVDDTFAIVSNSQEYKVSLERRLKNTIEDLIGKTVGIDHVRAEVNADINFDRIVTNSEIYDPEGQVVRSVQTIQENENATEGNASNVSVANNLPNTSQITNSPGGTSNVTKLDETTNFEITKTIKNHVSETGTVKRISIAVLVDGTYKYDEASGEVKYTPRTPEELKAFEELIRPAVGYDLSRKDEIKIVNLQFSDNLEVYKPEKLQDWVKKEFAGLMQTIIVAIVVLLFIVLIVRPIAIRAFEFTQADMEEPKPVTDVSSIDISNMQIQPEPQQQNTGSTPTDMIEIQEAELFSQSNTIRSINELVSRYPKETVVIIRKWLEENS